MQNNYAKCRRNYERALERMHEQVMKLSHLESVIRSSMLGYFDQDEIRSWLHECKRLLQRIDQYQTNLSFRNNPQFQDLYLKFKSLGPIVRREKETLQGYLVRSIPC
ncbi:MAG TPA: hypothetical protein VJJ75_00935 [Candidatus Nanoarchaeia archaeon]|nr:hypothetical protein [Candidatus Nanoarchaeia archaeon]